MTGSQGLDGNRPLRILATVLIIGCWSALAAALLPRASSPSAVGTAPLTTTVKPSVDTRELEQRTHELVNDQRASRGLQPLAHTEQIRLIARSHSEDMAARDYFGHETPEGLGPADRGRGEGYNCRKNYGSHYTTGLGENIYRAPLYHAFTKVEGRIVSYVWLTPEGLARKAVTVWMGNERHRENILTASYDRAGVGVAVAKDGKAYFTQNFC